MTRDSNKTPAKTRLARSRANGSRRLGVTLTGDRQDLLTETGHGEKLLTGPVLKESRRFPPDIAKRATRKLEYLDLATHLGDFESSSQQPAS